MKKQSLLLMTAFVLLSFAPTQLCAATKNKTTAQSTTTPAKEAVVNSRVARAQEIYAMDVSTMSKSEKKELSKEVRTIKSELKANGESTYIEGSHGGLYVSVGAAILIVVLLIVLL
jgi:hypothetical protein